MTLLRILRVSIVAAMTWITLAGGPAAAADFKDYEASAFAAAQSEGRPILLDVSAWWCPVCASQRATIKETVGAPAYAKLVIFHINYDRQEAVWKAFGVARQATLIAFKGKQEIGRLDYVTDKVQIRTLLTSVVS
jgi:thioredoxin 1